MTDSDDLTRVFTSDEREWVPIPRITKGEAWIKVIHAELKCTYGAPRIHAQLRRDGVHSGKKRVARLLVAAGLAGRCPRHWRTTTIADPSAEARAVDLIKRLFGPASPSIPAGAAT
jgi:hypothetical protein